MSSKNLFDQTLNPQQVSEEFCLIYMRIKIINNTFNCINIFNVLLIIDAMLKKDSDCDTSDE